MGNSKPRIYGFCDAGCKWEAAHKSDLYNMATYVQMNRDAAGNYRLVAGNTYKIFGGADAWGFSMNITWRWQYQAAYWTRTDKVEFPDFEPFNDGVLFKIIQVDGKGTKLKEPDRMDTGCAFRLVYKWNGETRYQDLLPETGLTCPTAISIVYLGVELINATDCVLVNEDIQTVAVVPPATEGNVGGVKAGKTVIIDEDGTLNVNENAIVMNRYCGDVDSLNALFEAITDEIIVPKQGDMYRILNEGGTLYGAKGNTAYVAAGDFVMLVSGSGGSVEDWVIASSPECKFPARTIGDLTLSPTVTRYYASNLGGMKIKGTTGNFTKGYFAYIYIDNIDTEAGIDAAGVLSETSLNGKPLSELGKVTSEYLCIMRGSGDTFEWFYFGGK